MPRIKQNYISARGVYYDLEKSPYIYEDKLGNTFKFSSEKKLEMFENRVNAKEKDFENEKERLKKLGYDIAKDYQTNIDCLPKIVYNGMLYK